MDLIEISDGREIEEEKEQNNTYQNWFSNTYASDIQQVSLQMRVYNVMHFEHQLYDEISRCWLASYVEHMQRNIQDKIL